MALPVVEEEDRGAVVVGRKRIGSGTIGGVALEEACPWGFEFQKRKPGLMTYSLKGKVSAQDAQDHVF